MQVSGLNHFTIRCLPDQLPALLDFYARLLQLTPGARPVMPFDGYWLYAEGQPLVHLAAFAEERPASNTGPLDHISFRAHGIQQTRDFLAQQGIEFQEAPVEGWPLHQIFLRDPQGLKVELTFDTREEAQRA
jgi:catechol 2,3-dioxygenase-like lactoylglutathione lyase family enzyme